MSRMLSRLKRFWLEEEIPRWMGVCLVGMYTVGMFAVAYASTSHVECAFESQSRQTTHAAIELLASQLAGSDVALDARQSLLRQFAHRIRCEQLRIVDESATVLASIQVSEVGKPHVRKHQRGSLFPRRVENYDLPPADSGRARCLFLAPIAERGTPPKQPASLFVEAIVLSPSSSPGSLANETLALPIILAATGLLLLLYRRLRGHFRDAAQITENLSMHGDRIEQELTSLRISDELGPTAVCWNRLIDLTESLQQEALRSTASAELKDVLERSSGGGELAEALNAVPDGMALIRDPDEIVYVNASAARAIGLADGEEAARQALSELNLSPLGIEVNRVVREARLPNGSWSARDAIIHNDADGGSYRVRVAPVQASRQRGTCAVLINDISQQIRADKAREEFVSQVTHELRTPLTNIRAYVETLSSGMFDDPKVITECYNVITKETQRLSRLIEDILNVSQLEVGTMQLVMDDVDLHRLLTDSVADVRGLADEKSIDLQLSLPAKFPKYQGDRDKLTVVLNNLLGNALKYTQSDGSVRLGAQTDNGAILIQVNDTGPGIDASEHERIFDRFERSGDPEIQGQTGTGIGLTTAREIVRGHRGEITVVSAKGQGATFIVRLPCESAVASQRLAAVGA